MNVRFTNRFRSVWRWLTEPSEALLDPERRRQARLLLSLLAAMVPLAILNLIVRAVIDPGFALYWVPAAVTIVAAGVYALGRTKYAQWGGILLTFTMTVAVTFSMSQETRPAFSMGMIGLIGGVVLLGGLILPLWGTVVLALVNLGCVLLLPLYTQHVSWGVVRSGLNGLLFLCMLIVMVAAIRLGDRRRLERQSQELAIVHRMGAAAIASLDTYEVLHTTCRELAIAFGVPQVDAAILNEGGNFITVTVDYGAGDQAQALGEVIPLKGNPATQQVIANAEPVMVLDAQGDPRIGIMHDLMRQRCVSSVLILPLIVGDRVVGTIGLNSFEKREFSDEEVGLAMRATAAAASVLEHAQLYAAERKARQLSETLGEIARELNLAPDLDTALDLVLAHMERVIAFDSGSIMLLEGASMRVVALHGWERPEKVLGAKLDLRHAPLNLEVIQTRRPIVLSSATQDSRWLPEMGPAGWRTHLSAINSWIGVPLLIQERAIGMLTADKVERDYYSSQDAELALAFAGHAAVAIENARLLESERAQLKLAQMLQKVGALLTTRLSLEEVFEQIFDLLALVVDFDSVSVQLLDDEQRMELVAGRGFQDIELAQRIARTTAMQTLEERWGEGYVVVVPDTYQDSRWSPVEGSEQIRSWIGAALLAKDRVIGVLNVDSTQVNAYDAAIGETVAAFANQAAVAIENARLYEAARREIERRSLAEEEIRQLNASLERRVVERTARIEAVNRELEAFSYSVSHDLRAPLRRISGFNRALREDYGDKLDSEAKDYLHRIDAELRRVDTHPPDR